MEATWRTYLEGPKWMGGKSFLFELAQETETDLTIEGNTKGLLTEKIFFCVKGEAENVKNFKMFFENTIDEWNNE